MSEKNRMRMEIKEISAEGTFEGILSPYGNVDEGGDVVDPGAYTRTLKARGNKVPLLWQHKADVPVGELTLQDKPDGLWAKGQLLMELPEAQKAYLLIKARIVKGLSIGFEAIQEIMEAGVRHLKEIKLYEGSIVTFPMNEMALITAVKGKQDKGDFNEELSQRQMFAAFYQMQYALGDALQSAVWAEGTKEEKIALCDTILQQFTAAFKAYFPDYLDLLEESFGEAWSKGEMSTKAGAMISSANADKIQSACQKIKSGHDELMALLEDKSGAQATTLSSEPAETKADPGATHSAADDVNQPAEKEAKKLDYQSISGALSEMKAGLLAALKGKK
jgi:uncharacterized protein